MNAATILPIALPGAGAKNLASLAAAHPEPRRIRDGPVREVPEMEDTTL